MVTHFQLYRETDISGVSGTGIVADGTVFENGWVALSFKSDYHGVNIYADLETVEKVHGHGGMTKIVLLD